MIIFDLGGVILQEAETNLAQALPSDLDIERIDGKPPRIFNRMFAFINFLYGKDCKRDWIMGHISGRALAQKVFESIDLAEYNSFFTSVQERNLIRYGTEFILVPEKLVLFTHLHLEAFEFIKRCKDSDIRLLILSNWDPESFVLIKNKFQQFFNLFEDGDIVIPAHVGFVKPEQEIFKYMIEQLKLDIANTFFVDDSRANTTAAQQYGIKSVTHTNWQQTEQELVAQGLALEIE